MNRIALIEVQESDLENIKIPFTLYGIYQATASVKLKSLYLKNSDLRKQMSEVYKQIDKLQASNETD